MGVSGGDCQDLVGFPKSFVIAKQRRNSLWTYRRQKCGARSGKARENAPPVADAQADSARRSCFGRRAGLTARPGVLCAGQPRGMSVCGCRGRKSPRSVGAKAMAFSLNKMVATARGSWTPAMLRSYRLQFGVPGVCQLLHGCRRRQARARVFGTRRLPQPDQNASHAAPERRGENPASSEEKARTMKAVTSSRVRPVV